MMGMMMIFLIIQALLYLIFLFPCLPDSTGNQEGGLGDSGVEVLHLVLSHLVHGNDQFGISAEQKEAFLKTLRKDFPQERVPVVLAPLLYQDQQDISVEKLCLETVNMPKTLVSSARMHLSIIEHLCMLSTPKNWTHLYIGQVFIPCHLDKSRNRTSIHWNICT